MSLNPFSNRDRRSRSKSLADKHRRTPDKKKESASISKTALNAFKIALDALDSASKVIPHGGVLSPAIKGVLMAIDVIEVRTTTSYLVA